MENLIEYFSEIPSLHRSFILVGGISFFWLLEYTIPGIKHQYQKTSHARINIFFTLTTIIVNFSLAFLLVTASQWAVAKPFGLLQFIQTWPLWAQALIGLMVLDLIGAYFIHWLEHKVKWMWMFHLIHHSDRHVDTTTANRHHPGESVFRFIFTILAVIVVGAPMWLFFLYQSLSVVLSQFNHANIKLPSSLDSILSYIIVTPGMHHVHHHYVVPYTDTNYGNIFSIWDRIFGTFSKMKREEIIYGVDTCMNPKEHQHIKPLLKIPFQGYRKS